MNANIKVRLVAMSILTCALLGGSVRLRAQSFSSYAIGDDVTMSLGQFQLVLDPSWRRIFDILMTNSPLNGTLVTRHLRLYHNGTYTSPTLYDPTTMIGRSDPLDAGSPGDSAGVIAGRAPGRTYIQESQITVRPSWPAPSNGVHEVHTFIKSMHLTDSFTTRVGFSVKAGMLAPTRPVCAGQVEAGSPFGDFPANSFFNVYVVVDLPSGGLIPPIQLVNVDPLLVQQAGIFSFPPRVVYQHENSTAVSMYFNADVDIPDPINGGHIHATRGTLFGQLTLAGHGVGFGSADIDTFQAEIETESENGTMPVNPNPFTSIVIQDFSPDYNAVPPRPTLSAAQLAGNGSFMFTISPLTPNTTNILQVSTDLAPGHWQTLSTIIPTTSSVSVVDSDAANHQQRFYRLIASP